MHEWAPEIVVDADLARRLLRQFPDLVVNSLRPIAEGWDNSVWLVGDELAFRFPRREVAIPGVVRELTVLPALAAALTLHVPEPLFVGRPAEDYPWPFFGSRLIPGREASGVPSAARAATAPVLGRFLRRLHDLDVGDDLPVDFNRRADMSVRVPRARQRLEEVERLGLWRPPASVGALLDEAETLPAPSPSALVHGDLHFRHLLVDDEGRLTGVIDWGDVCRADPSVDLMILWSFLPPEARPAFLAAYGPVTEEQLLRARVLALFMCAALALYGHAEALTAVADEALAGLARAATAA